MDHDTEQPDKAPAGLHQVVRHLGDALYRSAHQGLLPLQDVAHQEQNLLAEHTDHRG